MERLDTHETLPTGMRDYLSTYGWRFNKKLCDKAVSKMRGRDGKAVVPYTKEEVEQKLKQYGITLSDNLLYDPVYVANMAKSDYYGSSLQTEQQLFLFVKDYITDSDGDPNRALDEYISRCIGIGAGIDWGEYL